jgi:hypothetical protein
MECLMVAQTQQNFAGNTTLAHCSSSAPKHCSKKLSGLSRNTLVIVCEYLSFFQIVMLSGTSKKIKCKLDNFLETSSEVSYLKRRAIIYFQSFFFQQFPAPEVFFKRMGSITSNSTLASSGYLPLTKQSSLCISGSKSILPQLTK